MTDGVLSRWYSPEVDKLGEVLANVVLGALSGYFIQNLFLFDTPSTMLQLALLMAWVANQEREPADLEPGQMDR